VVPTRRSLLAGVAALTLAGVARAQPAIRPAVIYAVGEKFDGSFNEAALRGHERFRSEHGTDFIEYLPTQLSEFPRAAEAVIRRGATDVTAVGFYWAQPLAEAAPHSPDVRFNLIDAVADGPNIRSITFRAYEGSFLTGVIAGLTSKTGKLGFIVAMDIPLLREFVDGFRDGARWARPETELLVGVVGTTPAAFNDPTTAAELAKAQFARGVDVVFAGAGSSNFGIFDAARQAGRFAIGVDSNQNGAAPGTVLTSMLKRVDVAVIDALEAAREGHWHAGPVSLGLREDAVGWALDQHNEPHIPQSVRDRVGEARRMLLAR
jgi:basic membrane protein A